MTEMIVTVQGLNVRSEPDRNAALIATLPQFTRVEVVDVKGDWVRTDLGWMFSQYVCGLTKRALCIGFVLAEEGGLSQDKNDPGNWTGGKVGQGRFVGTKYGISAFSYPNLDIVNLSLAKAREIYYLDWYSNYDGHAWPICLYRMDAAVNMGKHAETYLMNRWDNVTPENYLQIRANYYRGLANFNLYGEAWIGRVTRCGNFGRSVSPIE